MSQKHYHQRKQRHSNSNHIQVLRIKKVQQAKAFDKHSNNKHSRGRGNKSDKSSTQYLGGGSGGSISNDVTAQQISKKTDESSQSLQNDLDDEIPF